MWFEYVASGANIADLPSRGELAVFSEYPFTSPPRSDGRAGAARVAVVFPDVAVWGLDLEATFASVRALLPAPRVR